MRKYVGERIKALRQAQEMGLEQLSKLAGITVERLAAYEEGSAVPAIGAVIQLGRVLGLKSEGILPGADAATQSLAICRAGESYSADQDATEQSYTYQSLMRSQHHRMEPFILTFDPLADTPVPITHAGEEFVHILEGAVELCYDGRRYRLDAGDSAYLESLHPHSFHGLGPHVARMLAVVSA